MKDEHIKKEKEKVNVIIRGKHDYNLPHFS